MINGKRRAADALLSFKRRNRMKARATERKIDKHHFVSKYLLTLILSGRIFFSIANFSLGQTDRRTNRQSSFLHFTIAPHDEIQHL
jgi:hypothetical protein